MLRSYSRIWNGCGTKRESSRQIHASLANGSTALSLPVRSRAPTKRFARALQRGRATSSMDSGESWPRTRKQKRRWESRLQQIRLPQPIPPLLAEGNVPFEVGGHTAFATPNLDPAPNLDPTI